MQKYCIHIPHEFPISHILSRITQPQSNSGALDFDHLGGLQKLYLLFSESIEPFVLPLRLSLLRGFILFQINPTRGYDILGSVVNTKHHNIEDVYFLQRAIRSSYIETLFQGDDEAHHENTCSRILELDTIWLVSLLHIQQLPVSDSFVQQALRISNPIAIDCASKFLESHPGVVSPLPPMHDASSTDLNSIVSKMELIMSLYNTFPWDHSLYCGVQNHFLASGIGQIAMSMIDSRESLPHALAISQFLPKLKHLRSKSISTIDLDLSSINYA